MAVLGILPVVQAQRASEVPFAAACAYLAKALAPGSLEHVRVLALAPGQTERIELAGGASALAQVYCTKPRAEGKSESHQRNTHLQAIVASAELIELTPARKRSLQEGFSAERDGLFCEDFTRGSRLRVDPGEVAVFFPLDAHLPSVAADAPGRVDKSVVKVSVGA